MIFELKRNQSDTSIFILILYEQITNKFKICIIICVYSVFIHLIESIHFRLDLIENNKMFFHLYFRFLATLYYLRGPSNWFPTKLRMASLPWRLEDKDRYEFLIFKILLMLFFYTYLLNTYSNFHRILPRLSRSSIMPWARKLSSNLSTLQ